MVGRAPWFDGTVDRHLKSPDNDRGPPRLEGDQGVCLLIRLVKPEEFSPTPLG